MILYGEETKKSLKNFPFSNGKIKMEFILAMVRIKKAAAIANFRAGNLDSRIQSAIVKACDFVLKKPDEKQFPLSSFQGGAGTASHMNVNEVIARVADSFLKNKSTVHPYNHVNASQSTNDVCPSALRIASFYLLGGLLLELRSLILSLRIKAKEFKKITKLGRTHLQDAVPTTLGAEFEAYAVNLNKHLARIEGAKNLCLELPLGGTAIGNSINANPRYVKEVYRELNKIFKGHFYRARNMQALIGGQTDFLVISQAITALAVDLSKISSDLRFMSSGPRGGIGEIILPELQKGSSIMPGKVNPVMPEAINQLYYLVSGNNLSIEKAGEAAQLELGAMFPVIADRLLNSLKLSGEAIRQFNRLCIRGIKADKEKCRHHLENSTAYATLFVPLLGYDAVSDIVRRSISENKTLREVIVGEKHVAEKDFNKIIHSFHFN